VKVFCLIFIFILAYGGVSCSPPTSDLGSGGRTDDGDDDGDGDDNDHQHPRTCSDRDSCQDICDDLFSHTTERYDCYDLSASEVNTITNVADELYDLTVSLDKLEDLDADDVRTFLSIGFDSFVDIVKGETVGDDDSHTWHTRNDDGSTDTNNVRVNSLEVMEWIAETEDIAEVILGQDRNFELGLELFQAVGGTLSANYQMHDDSVDTSDLYVCPIGTEKDVVNYGSNSACSAHNGRLLDLDDFTGVEQFLSGFLSQEFSSDSFMTFSADERNERAFEWGHNTLLEFCKEATDEDEGDVEVKTCLQATYCIHRNVETGGVTGEGIFRDLDDYNDIVGRTDVDNCADLALEGRMERLFE